MRETTDGNGADVRGADAEQRPGLVRVRLALEEASDVDPLVAMVLLRLALWARDGRAASPAELVALVTSAALEWQGGARGDAV